MPGFMERFTSNNNSNDNNQQSNQNQNDNNQNNNQNNQNNQNQNNNSNNDNNNSNNNDNNNSNNDNNMDNNINIWDNNDSNNENNDQNNNQQNNQNNQNNQNTETRSAGEIFNDHVASLKLTEGVDVNQIQEDLGNNNTESLQAAFETVASNTFKAGLQQMNKLADTKIEAAIEKAVSESSANVNENMAVSQMKSSLPFVDDVNIAPVAEAALKQLMAKGLSVEDSIKKVAQFFESTAEKVNGNSQAQNSPGNGSFNPNSNVNNNNSNNNNSNQEEGWMDFLTNKG